MVIQPGLKKWSAAWCDSHSRYGYIVYSCEYCNSTKSFVSHLPDMVGAPLNKILLIMTTTRNPWMAIHQVSVFIIFINDKYIYLFYLVNAKSVSKQFPPDLLYGGWLILFLVFGEGKLQRYVPCFTHFHKHTVGLDSCPTCEDWPSRVHGQVLNLLRIDHCLFGRLMSGTCSVGSDNRCLFGQIGKVLIDHLTMGLWDYGRQAVGGGFGRSLTFWSVLWVSATRWTFQMQVHSESSIG